MKASGTRIIKSLSGIAIFLVAYLFTSFILFPSTRSYISRVIYGAPPASELVPMDLSKVKSGKTIVLPQLEPLTDAAYLPKGKVMLVTEFSLKCVYSGESVPFWKRLGQTISAENAEHVLIGCGKSIDELKQFKEAHNLDGPLFYAPCEQLEPVFGSRGGITHCLIDKSGVSLGSWSGMPISEAAESRFMYTMKSELQKHRE